MTTQDMSQDTRPQPDAEYVALYRRLRAEGGVDLADQLHARYLQLERGAVTPGGLPYPSPSDPVAEGADAIRALAQALDGAWIPITAFLNGFSAATPAPAYAIAGNTIWLSGRLYRSSAPSFVAAFTLPFGPRAAMIVSTLTSRNESVQVTAAGDVQIQSNAAQASGSGYFLDGISFKKA